MAAPAKYNLIYFDMRGKAEPLRWMFVYAGQSFEDTRLPEMPHYSMHDLAGQPKPQWTVLKPKTPFGSLPVLEVDGEYLGETKAIARYLAPKLGLAGKDDWEFAQADSIITFLDSDFETPFMAFVKEMDPTRKEALKSSLATDITKITGTLERIYEKNNQNGGKGYFVGDTPTIADFFVVVFYEFTEYFVSPGALKDKTLFVEHRDRVRNLPGIKEFIAKYAHLPF